MTRKTISIALIQLFFAVAIVAIGIETELSRLLVCLLAVLSLIALVGQLLPARLKTIHQTLAGAGWFATGLIFALFWFQKHTQDWNDYFSIILWSMTATMWSGVQHLPEGSSKTSWKLLGMVWAFLASGSGLIASYVRDQVPEFYISLFSVLAVLILCRLWFRVGTVGIVLLHTLILLLVGFPLADLPLQFLSRKQMHLDPTKYYSYQSAMKNPAAYANWTRYYSEQWHSLEQQVFQPDPTHIEPFLMRHNSHGTLFQSHVDINSLGFRGREISEPKGSTYRIVALGESTTFGCTLNRDDRPWPEVLEQLIRERLKPARNVEVINAGIPAYTLHSNIRRIPGQILPLKPDMFISYHGLNGFGMIDMSLPPVIAEPPPEYAPRPLKLLADFEFTLKMRAYQKRFAAKNIAPLLPHVEPMKTQYAREYEQLIEIARTNGIQLMLANYSMAVNRRSDPALVNFYSRTYPNVVRQIAANEVHSEIVRYLGIEHPEVILVDTHPNFDGEYTNFIDLVHMTQGGRNHMAETMFAGIRKKLEQDLARPPKN